MTQSRSPAAPCVCVWGGVREFASGVLVLDASKNRVRDLQVSDNYAHGIFVSRTTDSTFARNSLFDNFSGLVVVESGDVAVVDNSVTGSERGSRYSGRRACESPVTRPPATRKQELSF